LVIHAVVILLICLAGSPAFGGEQRQHCLDCHRGHYVERGRCSSCHRGNPLSARRNIAHHGLVAGRFAYFTMKEDAVVREGQRLMEQFSCRRCHVSAGKGNHLATNLDSLRNQRSPEEIAASIEKPVLGMPDFSVTEQQSAILVNAILAGADSVLNSKKDRPGVVHFDDPDGQNRHVFSKKCASCHRLLSERYGAMGKGTIGPNLSGLLTRWYPRTFKNGERWNDKRLQEWLRNPRKVRNWANMQPVILSEDEFKQLVEALMINVQDQIR